MTSPLPRHPLGQPVLDAAIAELLGGLAALPGIRLHSLYLFGSYLDGSAAPSSDLDLFVVVEGALAPDDAARIRDAGRRASGSVELDLLPVGRDELLRDGQWRLQANSRLVAGPDLRPRLPPIALDAYLRRYTHAPYAYMAQVLRGVDHLDYPVDYPDPNGELYGYVRPAAAEGVPDERRDELKALVATVCWIATLTVGLQAGEMVASKRESAAAYQRHVGDEWAGFVEAVYHLGKVEWRYRLPGDPSARAELRSLCARMPAFENRYLRRYRDYLLTQLRDPDPAAARIAAERLGAWVHYPNPETRAALQQAATGPDPQLRAAATTALDHLSQQEAPLPRGGEGLG